MPEVPSLEGYLARRSLNVGFYPYIVLLECVSLPISSTPLLIKERTGTRSTSQSPTNGGKPTNTWQPSGTSQH